MYVMRLIVLTIIRTLATRCIEFGLCRNRRANVDRRSTPIDRSDLSSFQPFPSLIYFILMYRHVSFRAICCTLSYVQSIRQKLQCIQLSVAFIQHDGSAETRKTAKHKRLHSSTACGKSLLLYDEQNVEH